MNLTKVFLDNLKAANDGMTAMTDPKEKGKLGAQIALAVAATGSVSLDSIEAYLSSLGKNKEDALKPSASKGSKKKTAEKKKEESAPEPTPAEDVNETGESVEDDAEWTEAMCEKYSEELESLNAYFASEEEGGWGEEYMCETCIYEFSEHASNDKSFITPLNIQAFLIYLDSLTEGEE